MASLTPTSSALVELLVFKFCLSDIEYIQPLPIDMVAPVGLSMLGCTLYDASTHHLITYVLSAVRVYFRSAVLRR
jgi:hypothetical protein